MHNYSHLHTKRNQFKIKQSPFITVEIKHFCELPEYLPDICDHFWSDGLFVVFAGGLDEAQ